MKCHPYRSNHNSFEIRTDYEKGGGKKVVYSNKEGSSGVTLSPHQQVERWKRDQG